MREYTLAARPISLALNWCLIGGISLLACSQPDNGQIGNRRSEGLTQVTQHSTQNASKDKSAAAQQAAEVRTAGAIEVRQRLDQGEIVSVSLRLREDLLPVELAAARLTVERGLTAPGSKVTYNFRSGPGMGLLIASENDLQSLIDNPQVKSFGIAHKLEPMLNDSREILEPAQSA